MRSYETYRDIPHHASDGLKSSKATPPGVAFPMFTHIDESDIMKENRHVGESYEIHRSDF